MTHRELCEKAAVWLLGKPHIDLVSWELRYKESVLDVVGVNTHPRAKNPKLVIIEIKRTRADLLQDLRKRKMHKYQNISTHCYLAATPEALRADKLSVEQSELPSPIEVLASWSR